MSGGFQFYDIIIFALIAVFIILRLRAVLGRRTGQERPNERGLFSSSRSRRDEASADIVPIRPRKQNNDQDPNNEQSEFENLESDELVSDDKMKPNIRSGLRQIMEADPDFSPKEFVQGARDAFTMIVDAYSEGNTPILRPLLGDEVYDQFSSAISERIEAKNSHDNAVISVDEADIIKAEMVSSKARIAVRFVSKQITATYDFNENLIDGDPDKELTIADIWTFSRNIRSSSPNWLLVETRSE